MGDSGTAPSGASRKSSRPWWAAALVGGASAGITVAASLWLLSAQARGSEPTLATSGLSSQVLPPGSISLDQRLTSIETTLKALSDDMIEVKQRLPPKKP